MRCHLPIYCFETSVSGLNEKDVNEFNSRVEENIITFSSYAYVKLLNIFFQHLSGIWLVYTNISYSSFMFFI